MRNLLPLRYLDAVARSGSIRKAAETLAITSSALNRRILAMEEDLEIEIFERLPTGVRLSAAGEVYLHHIRMQLSDFERVKSQIADLKGMRRGQVSIACSQALLSSFLPKQIAAYRQQFPAVNFNINLRDRDQAEKSLIDHSTDLALVFEPIRMQEFQTLLTARQPIHAIMKQSHPLAAKKCLRLSDCLQYPLALPSMASGVRHLLEIGIRNIAVKWQPVVESDSFEYLRQYAMNEEVITFQIAIGLPEESETLGLITREICDPSVPTGTLYLGQLKGRILPIAVNKFAQHLITDMEARYDCA